MLLKRLSSCYLVQGIKTEDELFQLRKLNMADLKDKVRGLCIRLIIQVLQHLTFFTSDDSISGSACFHLLSVYTLKSASLPYLLITQIYYLTRVSIDLLSFVSSFPQDLFRRLPILIINKSAYQIDLLQLAQMLIKNPFTLYSLKRAAEESQQKANFTGTTMGVLIDATASVYRERDKDYITELKIIDQSVNEEQVYGVMVKFCTVYIFSKHQMQTCIFNKIGQLILLDKFIFNVWHSIKLETKYLSRTESLACLQVKGEQIKTMGVISTVDKDLSKSESVIKRGLKLHSWFLQFFFTKYSPTLGISLVNNYTLMAQPFNLILKRFIPQGDMLSEARQEDDKVYKFKDSYNNEFFVRKQAVKYELPEGKYLFIRGVDYMGHFYEINLIPTARILGLPQINPQAYDSIMNYCAASRFNERFLLKNHKPCNLSRITYIPAVTTPICELIEQQNLYQNRRSKREEQRVEDYYMIEGVVVCFKGDLHMFHVEHQMIIHQGFIDNLSDDERRQLIEENKLSYLYQGFIGVLDRSSESSTRMFHVHLFTNERRAQFFDPSLIQDLIKKAESDFTRNLQKEVKDKIEEKLKNLVTKSSFSNTVSMLLEPIKADTLIFRLTNTTFE